LIADPHMVAIIIASLLAAIALAGLAVYLTTTRGNRISDFDKGAGAALDVQVLNQFKLATGAPIVALYFLSIVAGIGVPGMITYLTSQGYTLQVNDWYAAHAPADGPTITLTEQLDREPKNVCVESGDVNVNVQARLVAIPLRYVTKLQSFILNVDDDWNDPITVNALLTQDMQHVQFNLSGSHSVTLPVVGGVAAAHLSLPKPTTLPGIAPPQNEAPAAGTASSTSHSEKKGTASDDKS
jgi:hypothetical protein